MHRALRKTIADIRSLRIQGARNVAKEAMKSLMVQARESKAGTPLSFSKDIKDAAEALSMSRPTEPMMRNLLDEAVRHAAAGAKSGKSLPELRRMLLAHEKEMLARVDAGARRLAEYGAKLIPDGALVLTHCHSSTSTSCMIAAKRMRKRFSVVSFETRPRFQGRKTAAELAKAGIDVTSAVDGAMNLFMKKADIVIVGADSVTSRGDLINKIGTSTLAHIARMNDVSFYSAAELFKYSPMTMFGNLEKIEERDRHEVWERPPRGVKIRNPAFEATAAKYISGYITEDGVIPPQSFFSLATQKLGIKIYGDGLDG
jgi:ribose 1,5-bisphosphate isomerase